MKIGEKIELEDGQSPLDALIPPQDPPRESLFRTKQNIRSIKDVLPDSELCHGIVTFFDLNNLPPNKYISDEVEESKDELVLMLEELDLVRADWVKMNTITHRPVGQRLIPYAYSTNKVRDTIDLIKKVHQDLEKLNLREQQEYFEQRKWESPRPRLQFKSQPILNRSELVLDLEKARLQFKNNKPIIISPKNKEVRLLKMLMETDSIVEYTQIGAALTLNCYNDAKTNDDPILKREANYIRRDMSTLLQKTGLKKVQIAKLIQSKRNVGYIMIDFPPSPKPHKKSH